MSNREKWDDTKLKDWLDDEEKKEYEELLEKWNNIKPKNN